MLRVRRQLLSAPSHQIGAGGAEAQEDAPRAEGYFATRLFRVVVQERVVFIEKLDIVREVVMKDGLEGLIPLLLRSHAQA